MGIKAYVLKPYVYMQYLPSAMYLESQWIHSKLLLKWPKTEFTFLQCCGLSNIAFISIYYSMSSPKITLSILGHQTVDRNH